MTGVFLIAAFLTIASAFALMMSSTITREATAAPVPRRTNRGDKR